MTTSSRNRFFRGLLWVVCCYHVVLAVVAFLPPSSVAATASALLGLRLPDEPALFQIIKSFGVYAGVFGVMMGLAAWDPIKNRAMISVGIVLFALRIAQRLTNLAELERSFGVPPARNVGTVVIVALIGCALAWYRWMIWREMRAEKRV